MPAFARTTFAAALLLLASHAAATSAENKAGYGVVVEPTYREILDTPSVRVIDILEKSRDGIEEAMKTVSVRSVEVPKNSDETYAVRTKVGWVSSITFRDPNGRLCAYHDVIVGSEAFEIKPTGAGTIHVLPKITGAATNLNVSVVGGRGVMTLVLVSGDDTVDARTEIVMDCPLD
jgi:hypothetical protein